MIRYVLIMYKIIHLFLKRLEKELSYPDLIELSTPSFVAYWSIFHSGNTGNLQE